MKSLAIALLVATFSIVRTESSTADSSQSSEMEAGGKKLEKVGVKKNIKTESSVSGEDD